MKHGTRLFVDQYGSRFYAATVKGLRLQIADGGSRVRRMYVYRDGKTFAVGYVIGSHRLREYRPYEVRS